MLTSLSITCCGLGQQGMPSLLCQLHLNNFKVTISVICISWFSWPGRFTRVPSCQNLHYIMFQPSRVVRNAFETPALLALDYFTCGILILIRITFLTHIPDQGWANIFYGEPHWRFYCYRGSMLVLHILHLQSLWKLKKVLHELPQNEGNNSHFGLSRNAVSNDTCGKNLIILI